VKLFRFRHSCYAWKVQALFELAGVPFEAVDVPYADRTVLLQATGGYGHVPVLVLDDGEVLSDSRAICAHLTANDDRFRGLVPAGQQALVWGYADWVDTGLEETIFRLAVPALRERFSTANERSLFTLMKERKYGAGCIEGWAARAGELAEEARRLLGPSQGSLLRQPFVCGAEPSLADAALFGQMAMLAYADRRTLRPLGDAFPPWLERLFERGVSRDNWRRS